MRRPGSGPAWLRCAVCFGLSDDPRIPAAFTWGIFLLMAVTFAVLGALVFAAWRIEARRKALP